MDVSVEVGSTRIRIEEWASTDVRFHGFAHLQSEVGFFEVSPVFTCCGNKWTVHMYSSGDGEGDSNDVMTSMYLCNLSDNHIVARFQFILRGPDGAMLAHHLSGEGETMFSGEEGTSDSWGVSEFVERSKVMESLVEGAMVVDVRIMRIDTMSTPFVPENPHLKNSVKLFMDEETADVIFKVGIRNKGGKRKRGKEFVDFHAHRLVLKHNAPVLAEFCGPGEGSGAPPVAVPVKDVGADIFRHLLYYVYGGEIKGEDMKERAKEIIDAANRYGVVGLKLQAEARYVESTKLSAENVMEHLLYADAKNCALMKEAVMDFVLANGVEVLEKVSFDDCPGGLMKDLLAAATRSKRRGNDDSGNAGDQYVTMRVGELRRRLHEKGLDIDGSREAMIAALRESS